MDCLGKPLSNRSYSLSALRRHHPSNASDIGALTRSHKVSSTRSTRPTYYVHCGKFETFQRFQETKILGSSTNEFARGGPREIPHFVQDDRLAKIAVFPIGD